MMRRGGYPQRFLASARFAFFFPDVGFFAFETFLRAALAGVFFLGAGAFLAARSLLTCFSREAA